VKQPICDPCWVDENSEWEITGDGTMVPVSYSIPTMSKGFPLELCCLCNRHTIAGIYIVKRADEVPFPSLYMED